jgi:CPA1 family monovalent cation:H+ antiporter
VERTVEAFVALLLAVAALGFIARKIKLPYPILLVAGGLVLGLVPGVPRVRLNPDLIFFCFLPPLLFPAALFTSWRDFRFNLRPILLLAIGLVLFTTCSVAFLAHALLGLPLAAAFVLGAIVSPPDAIAAEAIAERLSIPRRIVAILEGESLVNDATALVALRFAVAAVATGSFSVVRAGGEFLLVAAGGIAIGLAVGWLAAKLHRHIDDPPVEVTLSLLTPFVAYILAERCTVSGVLAVVTAGLYLGWRTPEITTSSTRLQGGPFWNMVEFLLNGFVFIFIGLELPQALRAFSAESLRQLVWSALIITLAVILVRVLWVFPATYLPRLLFKSIRRRDPYPAWQHVTIVAWTGMRGVVSLAAALALPLNLANGAPFPARDTILFLTFTVIMATLVVQGLSLPFLIRRLGVKDDNQTEKEERDARLKANQAALARLREIAERDPSKADALERLRIEYEDRLRQLESYEPESASNERRLFSSEYENLSFEALRIERQIILKLRNEALINDEVLRRIQRDLDLAEERLRHRE